MTNRQAAIHIASGPVANTATAERVFRALRGDDNDRTSLIFAAMRAGQYAEQAHNDGKVRRGHGWAAVFSAAMMVLADPANVARYVEAFRVHNAASIEDN